MSVAAGALWVQLSKRGVYQLGADLLEPAAEDVRHALRLTAVAAWSFILVAATVQLVAMIQLALAWPGVH